jgi:hypothetical protein
MCSRHSLGDKFRFTRSQMREIQESGLTSHSQTVESKIMAIASVLPSGLNAKLVIQPAVSL